MCLITWGIYYGDWLMQFMEAEKYHKLPSASWQTRKACGIIQSECKGQNPQALNM